MIYRPGCLCSTTILHCNSVTHFIFFFQLQLLQFQQYFNLLFSPSLNCVNIIIKSYKMQLYFLYQCTWDWQQICIAVSHIFTSFFMQQAVLKHMQQIQGGSYICYCFKKYLCISPVLFTQLEQETATARSSPTRRAGPRARTYKIIFNLSSHLRSWKKWVSGILPETLLPFPKKLPVHFLSIDESTNRHCLIMQ